MKIRVIRGKFINMNIEQIREYCLSKKGTSEDFPFDEDTLVFKVLGKMFALTSLKKMGRRRLFHQLKMRPRLRRRTSRPIRQHLCRIPHEQKTLEYRKCP